MAAAPVVAPAHGGLPPVAGGEWGTTMSVAELAEIRAIALALPEVTERLSHGAPCFYIRDERPLCYFHDAEFSADGRTSLWCPAPPGLADELVDTEPGTYFRPTPSASGTFAGWLGVYLDEVGTATPVREEIAAIVEMAYRTAAPKTLIAELDNERR